MGSGYVRMMACGRGTRVLRTSIAWPPYPPVMQNVSEKQATYFQNTANILVYFHSPQVVQRATYQSMPPFLQPNRLSLERFREPPTKCFLILLSYICHVTMAISMPAVPLDTVASSRYLD